MVCSNNNNRLTFICELAVPIATSRPSMLRGTCAVYFPLNNLNTIFSLYYFCYHFYIFVIICTKLITNDYTQFN